MRSFAEAWPEKQIVQQVAALLPWGHHMVLLDRLKDAVLREWYLRAAVEYGWSRNVMVLQIQSGLHKREGKALTNFNRALPPPDSDLAEQILKDPYNFDFLTVSKKAGRLPVAAFAQPPPILRLAVHSLPAARR